MTTTQRINLLNFSAKGLADFVAGLGEKSFRARQLLRWVHHYGADSFDTMSDLAKSFRAKLSESAFIQAPAVVRDHTSSDGTRKWLLDVGQGNAVETVFIPEEDRGTLCISTQAGCAVNCRFCSTGKQGFNRNLSVAEIIGQLWWAERELKKSYGIAADGNRVISNVVLMGMGEPLLNYKNVLKSIERITSPDGLGMSPRRITVSTAGVAKQIKQLGDDEVKFKLALSLHAANDEKRHEIMPINDTNNIKSLVEALNHFYKKTGNEITFEYILFKDFNDSLKDADELIKLYRQVPADLINIIEYNPIDMATYQKPEEKVTDAFMHYLERNKVNARLRRSRGKDIDAACGQLANKEVLN